MKTCTCEICTDAIANGGTACEVVEENMTMKSGHINNWAPEVRSLVNRLSLAGFAITRACNGEDTYTGTKVSEIVECVTACDEGELYVTAPDGKCLWLMLVLGNSPGELVSDYSCHEALEAVVTAHGDHWEGKPQPTKPCAYQKKRDAFNAAAAAAAVRAFAGNQPAAAAEQNKPCYVVLSVGELRRMLATCEERAKVLTPGNVEPSCFSFESTVRPDSKGVLQVYSYDIAKGPR
jgi:hypothetical protein